MRICFWQNMPSHIQAPVMRELAKLRPQSIHAIWCSDLSEDRRRLGWRRPNFGEIEQTTLPTRAYEPLVHQILTDNSTAIHVFSGMHAYAPIADAFNRARKQQIERIAVMAERGNTRGLKGLLRKSRVRWHARMFADDIRLILAMGQAGVDYYRDAGFSQASLFPFLYQSDWTPEVQSSPTGDPIRLVYVGKFSHRKGPDVMLRALSTLLDKPWTLTVVGDGPEADKLRLLAKKLRIDDRIEWRGVLASDQMAKMLVRHDLCIVPSRFEGWGVVTNEAICAGIPVVCSDRVASGELINRSGAGRVFAAGSSSSLAEGLAAYLSATDSIDEAKQRAIEFREYLQPDRIALYLDRVLKYCFEDYGERPVLPWARVC